MNDYLGKAAELQRNLKLLIKVKDFEKAWGLTHELSELHVKHINSVGYGKTPEVLAWANCFANSVAEFRAEILSKEGKHLDALLQSVWRAAIEHRPIKKYVVKMQSYFKKAKLDLSEEELMAIYIRARKHKDFFVLKSEFEKFSKK